MIRSYDVGMVIGSGAHFHLSGDTVGKIHQRHGGARAAHSHNHDHSSHSH